MYVVKIRGGYMCANTGATKHLKFATRFDSKKRAEEVAKKWLRSDIPYKVVEKESEEMLINEKRGTGYISRGY